MGRNSRNRLNRDSSEAVPRVVVREHADPADLTQHLTKQPRCGLTTALVVKTGRCFGDTRMNPRFSMLRDRVRDSDCDSRDEVRTASSESTSPRRSNRPAAELAHVARRSGIGEALAGMRDPWRMLRRREVFYVGSTLAVAGGVLLLAVLEAPVVVVLAYIGVMWVLLTYVSRRAGR